MERVPDWRLLEDVFPPQPPYLLLLQLLPGNTVLVRRRRDHIKEAAHAVEGVPRDHDHFFARELAHARALRVVRFYDQHGVVHEGFADEAHLIQLPIELPLHIAVRPSIHPRQPLQIPPDHRISAPRVRGQRGFRDRRLHCLDAGVDVAGP